MVDVWPFSNLSYLGQLLVDGSGDSSGSLPSGFSMLLTRPRAQRVVQLFIPSFFIPPGWIDSVRFDFCFSEVTEDIWEHERND